MSHDLGSMAIQERIHLPDYFGVTIDYSIKGLPKMDFAGQEQLFGWIILSPTNCTWMRADEQIQN